MSDRTGATPRASQALAGIRVLDLTRVRAGPTCARQLADWGADVIKIEAPPSDDGSDPFGGARDGPDFQNLHRNKRSITLDLKAQAGRAVLLRLAAGADVLAENFRPDVKHRLRIGYDDLAAVNPRLVYASISGFGQDGPYAGRAGFDQIAQGMGGLMSITGLPGQGPVRAGIPIADLTAGLLAAQGILVALIERARSGLGQWVTTSLLEAQVFMLDFQAARYLQANEVPGQAGNNHPTYIPTGVFACADGHINIAASGQPMWERLARALGQGGWLDDPRFATGDARSANRDVLNALIEAVTRTGGVSHWEAVLNEAGVPCGTINRVDQVFSDPQVRHLGMAARCAAGGVARDYVRQGFALSRTPSAIVSHPPQAGADNNQVLMELGYAPDEIAKLRADRVI